MSMFIIRVELHGASDAIYETLHKAMAAAGYYRQINADSGDLYHLPTATYEQTFSEDHSSIQIRNHVKPIVDRVWTASEIIAIKYVEAAWVGLSGSVRKAA